METIPSKKAENKIQQTVPYTSKPSKFLLTVEFFVSIIAPMQQTF